MPRKSKPPPDDPEQSKRFIEAAREIGTDESPEAFECVFNKIISKSPRKLKNTNKIAHKPSHCLNDIFRLVRRICCLWVHHLILPRQLYVI